MALVLGQNRNQPICRSDSFSASWEHNYTMMEKRQMFLRSYQFCRKRSLAERIKGSLVGVKRVMWFRLRSARKLRRLVWSRLRLAFYYRRRRFVRLVNNYHHRQNRMSSCFW
ncbi:hypothetical protein SLA2020_458920 [Shorea laevis]